MMRTPLQFVTLAERARTAVSVDSRLDLLQLSAKLDELGYGMLVKDERLRVVYGNTTYENLVGSDVFNQVLGKKFAECYDHLSYFDDSFGERVEESSPFAFQRLVRLEFVPGIPTYYRHDELPVKTQDGVLCGLVYIIQEITSHVAEARRFIGDISTRRLLVAEINHQIMLETSYVPEVLSFLENSESSDESSSESSTKPRASFCAAKSIDLLHASLIKFNSLINSLESDIYFDVYQILLDVLASQLDTLSKQRRDGKILFSIEPLEQGEQIFRADPIRVRALLSAMFRHANLTASLPFTYINVKARTASVCVPLLTSSSTTPTTSSSASPYETPEASPPSTPSGTSSFLTFTISPPPLDSPSTTPPAPFPENSLIPPPATALSHSVPSTPRLPTPSPRFSSPRSPSTSSSSSSSPRTGEPATQLRITLTATRDIHPKEQEHFVTLQKDINRLVKHDIHTQIGFAKKGSQFITELIITVRNPLY